MDNFLYGFADEVTGLTKEAITKKLVKRVYKEGKKIHSPERMGKFEKKIQGFRAKAKETAAGAEQSAAAQSKPGILSRRFSAIADPAERKAARAAHKKTMAQSKSMRDRTQPVADVVRKRNVAAAKHQSKRLKKDIAVEAQRGQAALKAEQAAAAQSAKAQLKAKRKAAKEEFKFQTKAEKAEAKRKAAELKTRIKGRKLHSSRA